MYVYVEDCTCTRVLDGGPGVECSRVLHTGKRAIHTGKRALPTRGKALHARKRALFTNADVHMRMHRGFRLRMEMPKRRTYRQTSLAYIELCPIYRREEIIHKENRRMYREQRLMDKC